MKNYFEMTEKRFGRFFFKKIEHFQPLRDESVCVYTHSAFLLVADSKRFVMFDVKTGNFISILIIPTHLERSKGQLYANIYIVAIVS